MGVAWLILGCSFLNNNGKTTVLASYPCAKGELDLIEISTGPNLVNSGTTKHKLRYQRQEVAILFTTLPEHLRTGMGPPMERTRNRDTGKMMQVFMDPIFVKRTDALAIRTCAERNATPLYTKVATVFSSTDQPTPELVFWSGFPSQLEPVFFGPLDTKFQVERDGTLRFVAVPTATRPLHVRDLGEIRGGTAYCCTQDPAYFISDLKDYTDDQGQTLEHYLGAVEPLPPDAAPQDGPVEPKAAP
ncbi:MAG: hypothetical protein ACI9VR_003139 [Cognaticolwellia sp.]|jgi:hypothetical protein